MNGYNIHHAESGTALLIVGIVHFGFRQGLGDTFLRRIGWGLEPLTADHRW